MDEVRKTRGKNNQDCLRICYDILPDAKEKFSIAEEPDTFPTDQGQRYKPKGVLQEIPN